jgi:hypothetical protein
LEKGNNWNLKQVRVGVPSTHVLKCLKHYWLDLIGAILSAESELERIITVGIEQTIAFFVDEEENSKPYSEYHICVYFSEFERLYRQFHDMGYLHTQHRHTDRCETWELTKECRQFRLRDVYDLEDPKKVVFSLELECRSLAHPAYRANRYVSQNN